jgi:hypothetical protein
VCRLAVLFCVSLVLLNNIYKIIRDYIKIIRENDMKESQT